jgi:hypothetical protein
MSRVAPSNNRRTSAPGSVEQSSKVSDISAFTRASMSNVPATDKEKKVAKKPHRAEKDVSMKNIYGHTPTSLNRRLNNGLSPTASIRQIGKKTEESLTTLRLQMMATMESKSKTHSSKGRGFLNQTAHIGSSAPAQASAKTVFTAEEKLSLKKMKKIIRKVNRFSDRKKRVSMFLSALWLLAFLASFTEQQILWDNENKASDDTDSLKCFVCLISILMALAVLWRRHLLLSEQKILGAVPKDVFLWNSHLTAGLILEMLFNLFCAPPFFNYEFEYQITSGQDTEIYAFYTLDVLASVFIVARIYHVVPLLGHWLRIEDAHSKVYARLNSVSLDDHFTAKVLMKTNPLAASTFLAVVICCILSYCCWIFERGYCAPWANQYLLDDTIYERCSVNNVDRSDEIGDAFWAMMSMMTTLGNSTAPLTPMGRLVSAVGLVSGLSVLAMLLNAMVQNMSLNPFEKRTLDTIQRQKQRIRSYSKAATLIEAAWLRYRAYKKNRWHVNRLGAIAHFSRMQHRFREHRKQTSRLEQLQSEYDILGANIEHAVDLKIRDLRDEMRTKLERIEYAVCHGGSLEGYVEPRSPPRITKRDAARARAKGGGSGGSGGRGGAKPDPKDEKSPTEAKRDMQRSNSDPSKQSPRLVPADLMRRKTEKISKEALEGMALSADEAMLAEAILAPTITAADMTPVTPRESLKDRKLAASKKPAAKVNKPIASQWDANVNGKVKNHWLLGDAKDEEEDDSDSDDEKKPDQRDFHNIVVEMYQKHNPEKLDGVASLLGKYVGREQILLEKLAKKYGCKIPTGKPTVPRVEEEEGESF